ncbi:MAG: alpha/beta fold hydrolase [Clostridia bacterium]
MTGKENVYQTDHGPIHYWIAGPRPGDGPELVFLPGLTADHRLFDKQLEYFGDKVPVFVWDAPGHAASWPFALTFSLADKARWLNEILTQEGFKRPVIVGQSMGGYLGQMFAQLFPDRIAGFLSIDSAPLQRKYYTAAELWLLKKMGPVYRHYPWQSLLKTGSEGVATSDYGRRLMHDMMMCYDGDQARYAALAGHGYRMLAEAVEAELPYELPCPALLICGEKDRAGSCIPYNKAWHKRSGLPIRWIEGAGHNANTDRPEEINRLIGDFLETLS